MTNLFIDICFYISLFQGDLILVYRLLLNDFPYTFLRNSFHLIKNYVIIDIDSLDDVLCSLI